MYFEEPKKDTPFIGTRDQAEAWMTTNKYINTGFRVNFNTPEKATNSMFKIHNETTNIWSHLVGALFFAWIAVYMTIFFMPNTDLYNCIGDCDMIPLA